MQNPIAHESKDMLRRFVFAGVLIFTSVIFHLFCQAVLPDFDQRLLARDSWEMNVAIQFLVSVFAVMLPLLLTSIIRIEDKYQSNDIVTYFFHDWPFTFIIMSILIAIASLVLYELNIPYLDYSCWSIWFIAGLAIFTFLAITLTCHLVKFDIRLKKQLESQGKSDYDKKSARRFGWISSFIILVVVTLIFLGMSYIPSQCLAKVLCNSAAYLLFVSIFFVAIFAFCTFFVILYYSTSSRLLQRLEMKYVYTNDAKALLMIRYVVEWEEKNHPDLGARLRQNVQQSIDRGSLPDRTL